MRRAHMVTQQVSDAYFEDMSLDQNDELGDLGACRRR